MQKSKHERLGLEESMVEKHTRVRGEYKMLHEGNMSALQFGAAFEKCVI